MCHVSRLSCVMCLMSHVICHVSRVTCRLSPVTCHLSLTPKATSIDPPPDNSRIMHTTVGWFAKSQKPKNKLKMPKIIESTSIFKKKSRGIPIFAIRSLNRSLQSTGMQVFCDGTHRQHTDIATWRLNWPSEPTQWKWHGWWNVSSNKTKTFDSHIFLATMLLVAFQHK